MTPRRRELLIGAALTALFLLVRGYVFGSRDHAIHLAYIERAADPGFLAGDPLLDVAAQHPSFYFSLMALLSRIAPMEAVFLAGYALSVLAMIVGLRSLARRLWDGPAGEWAAAVAVAGVFVHRYVGGGIENLDPLLLPRVASLGPLLYALSLGARGRFYPAFALTGVVFLLHATTASHTAALLWAACAFGGRANLRACLLGPVVFLAAAGPLLVAMAIQGGPDIPTPAPEAWIQSLKLHFPFHHFRSPTVLAEKIVPAVVAILLGIAASRWRGAGRQLAGYLAGAFVLLAAAGLGNWILASPVTIHLHLFEVGRMLDYFAVLGLGRWTFAAARGPVWVKFVAALIAASYVIRMELAAWLDHRFVLDFYLLAAAMAATVILRYRRLTRPIPGVGRLLAWLYRLRRPAPSLWRGYAFTVVFGAALILVSSWSPHWSYDASTHPGYRMMQWARGNLPVDAVVIVPPYLDEVVCSFRYFARRRAIGAWKDGGEGTFDYEFQLAWERQVRDLTGVGNRIRVPDGTVFWRQFSDWLFEARRSYHDAPAAHFLAMAKRYGATHVVREAWSPKLALPAVFQNDQYVLYRCRAD